MQLHFEPNLDYQLKAIESTCELFAGQEIGLGEFTVLAPKDPDQQEIEALEDNLGTGNRLTLLEDEILSNLRRVQVGNGIAPSETLTSGEFTVEMETGTGKTYVYLRTIFELNKRYGFSKFVIVVPSVAIKEGVYKTLQITEDHLRALYGGTPYSYFIYDSSKLGQVRSFATSSDLQIMVTTVGAINKMESNKVYQPNEQTGGERPIDLISRIQPVLIVDEPQSVEGGLKGKGKEAMQQMNPLCTFRYSATPKHSDHMIYRLDAVDAYEQGLVKQIEVASATVEAAHNKAYVRCVAINSRGGSVTARLEMDVETANGVTRRTETASTGADLEQVTKRDVYANYRVGEISAAKDGAFVEIQAPGETVYLAKDETVGGVDSSGLHRQMIKRTIQEHFEKELRLGRKGVKVLSLFFVEEVGKYRSYDEDGEALPGPYAEVFEEEYVQVASHPKYQELFKGRDVKAEVGHVHDGYFSIDKKGRQVETTEKNQGGRDNAERGYNLIMKEKERLLSFDTPLRFIFSHSALREGWDNPNVFQICTLRDIKSETERRQTIGRGLRLCVNQAGERLRGFEVNTLTVVATEGYEEFAKGLQAEIEEFTAFRFGVVEKDQFAAVVRTEADGEHTPLGSENSEAIWTALVEAELIAGNGKVTDDLRTALKEENLELTEGFEAERPQIERILKKVCGRLEVKNADERKPVKTRQALLDGDAFKALWDRVKYQTTYRVAFDEVDLIKTCASVISEAPAVSRPRLEWRKAGISIGEAGVEATEKEGASTVAITEGDIELPDLLGVLQERTQLTRISLHKILVESGRLSDFKTNPQAFLDLVAELINKRKQLALVDGIKYQRLGEDAYYAQELFQQDELTAYVKNSLFSAEKSVIEPVIYDSDVEHDFAVELEHNADVKVYAKLPSWFKIPTPLGSYNPDWAVLCSTDGGERLYFVVETKGSTNLQDLRDTEAAKIRCGKEHFSAIANESDPAKYVVARSLEDVLTAAKGGERT
jgi:type III restriction enzyme